MFNFTTINNEIDKDGEEAIQHLKDEIKFLEEQLKTPYLPAIIRLSFMRQLQAAKIKLENKYYDTPL